MSEPNEWGMRWVSHAQAVLDLQAKVDELEGRIANAML